MFTNNSSTASIQAAQCLLAGDSFSSAQDRQRFDITVVCRLVYMGCNRNAVTEGFFGNVLKGSLAQNYKAMQKTTLVAFSSHKSDNVHCTDERAKLCLTVHVCG